MARIYGSCQFCGRPSRFVRVRLAGQQVPGVLVSACRRCWSSA
jgi:hypothetical protein